MQWIRQTGLFLLGIGWLSAGAQVTGGRHAFEYLRLPNAPHVSAQGGVNISNPDRDIAFAMQNPALMRAGLHNQMSLNYNHYYSGIRLMNLGYGYHAESIGTSFALGIQYLDYGSFVRTDLTGTELGNFNASDFVINLGASRSYGEKWRYGTTFKLAGSRLLDRSATALLADVGVLYIDTASLWTVAAVAKNMGFTVKKYNPSGVAEPLPFDLQLGITKRFRNVPFRLMTTLHHLYTWDIRYNNPDDIIQSSIFGNTEDTDREKQYFVDKLFRHFVFAGEMLIGQRIGVSVGYNHLRRGELGFREKMGLAGFSFGLGVYLDKLQVHYARSYYHIAGAYNEIGLNLALNRLIGIGTAGHKIHWNTDYGDVLSRF